MFFAVACTREDDWVDDPIDDGSEIIFTDAELKVIYQMRNENNRVGIEEATKFAHDVITFLEEEATVKSGMTRSIRSVTPVKFGKQTDGPQVGGQ